MKKVIGFAGWSGVGKTTLVEQVVGALCARGVAVSVIKHAHHDFDIDHEGKDSWRHRQAGCREVLVSSAQRWALIHELRGAPEASLDELLATLAPCDVVLVEGFKRAAIAKIEVRRLATGHPPLAPHDPHILAVASDGPISDDLPALDLNDAGAVADFIVAHCSLDAAAARSDSEGEAQSSPIKRPSGDRS